MNETTRAAWPMQLRALADERIVEGIAVPWGETSLRHRRHHGGAVPARLRRRARCARGATGSSCSATTTTPSPSAGSSSWTPGNDAGLWGAWQIAATPAGDAALTEIAEGMLDAFSIGFRTLKARRGADGAREIVEAEIHEVSLLPLGAYDGARVLAVRSPSYGADEISAWLDAHPAPHVDLAPIPDLGRYSRR